MNLTNVNFNNLPDNYLTGEEVFGGKRVVVFGLPGAFTPTCSSKQLPSYDEFYNDIIGYDIDEVYCVSVNDGFVMKNWFTSLGVEYVKPLADGNGDFTRRLGMLVNKSNLGFGLRSWRYAAVINNGVVEALLAEDGIEDNCETDPYENSTPLEVIEYLKNA
tara:strand:- start:222 stop:704 length:483 start_codon:yes stop_codon:yes gene_type:complete